MTWTASRRAWGPTKGRPPSTTFPTSPRVASRSSSRRSTSRCGTSYATPRSGLAAQRADLGGRLAQRLVDGLDDLLAGLVGPHGGDHVHHRSGGVGARALQRARADLAHGAGAAGSAGDERVAGLARVAQRDDVEAAWIDRAVRANGDRPAVAAQDRIAQRGDQAALRVGAELAVAGVRDAARGAHGEEALAGDREVQRLARVPGRLRREVGGDLVDLDRGAL